MRSVLHWSIPLLGFMAYALALWPQAANLASDDPTFVANTEDRMLTPPPVSGQQYPVALASQEQANSLRYGFTFSSGYSDNVLGAAGGHPVSDINYSIWPTIGIDATTSRMHWDFTYAPGFTFYQKTSARNQADHSAVVGFQYRLSPHVTFSVQDNFQKSSSVFNQPNVGSAPVFGGSQGPNDTIVAPLADQLHNYGTAGITYQYSRSNMIGAGGAFSNLYYPDKTQVTGLWDSSSQAGSAFYTHRFSTQHYAGVMYQYQRLMSYPNDLEAKTETDSVLLFYTIYANPRLSMSFYGGPQYSNTAQPAIASLGYGAFWSRTWTPAGGASLNWNGQFVSAALSYSHTVSSGGGLIGASHLDNGGASFRLQFTRNLTASVSGMYGNNRLLSSSVAQTNGHTISGTAAVQRRVGERFSLELGYTRLHQTYNVPVLLGTPDTNREFVSFSYFFSRPLGR